jgi:MFS transporter, DHA1 family, inner membrane transport protein
MSGIDSFAEPAVRNEAAGIAAMIGIAVIVSSYCINAMDRTLFPLILPEVAREYRFNLPDAGLISTVFTIGMAAAGLPAGYLMSRVRRRSVAQAGLFIFSAATILTVWANGFADMLLYRALTGIGEAMQLTALLAIMSAWFARYRGAAVGALNCAFGVGAIAGPLLGAAILSSYGTWRAPMIGFGLLGFMMMALVPLFVRNSVSEAAASAAPRAITLGGADTLLNRNTVLLLLLSSISGLSIFGFLGMYPTYLRGQLHFSASDAGAIMSIYGLGVLVSVGGGLLGDRFPIRPVIGLSFVAAAVIGWLLFNGPAAFTLQAALAFAFGVVFSGAIYVNLAAGHVKAVRDSLSGQASGLFVTAFYAAASVAGYAIGWMANTFGWAIAGDMQLCLASLAGAALAIGLRPEMMARPVMQDS